MARGGEHRVGVARHVGRQPPERHLDHDAVGLGRERVLSEYGRDEAVERWIEGDGGPNNQMTKQAPGLCADCGYLIRLSGRLGRCFGVCANEFSPRDGSVVSIDHGCGAHSDVSDATHGVELPRPVWDTVTLDEMVLFD